jgi:putative ABC transport system permease protein
MGASRRQVLASVLAQGVAIGLLGSALGLVGGWGLIKLATWGMAQFDMTLAAASGISLVDAALALAAGTLTAVLGAALPARRAASVTPVEAMREPGEAPGKPLALRSLVGGMVLAGGAAACLTGALAAEPNGAVAGVGAAALVVGALIAAPGVGKLTAKAAEPVTSRLAGISGRLASRNIQRQPRRAALAGSALMIGLTLVAAAAVLAGSMRSAVTSVITQVFTTDLLVQSVNGEIPPPALAELRQLPEVRHADAYAEAPITYEGQDLWVGSSQTDAFGRTFTFETSPGAWAALAEGQAVVREAAAREQGWNTGDVLELEGPGARIAVTVGGTYQRGLGAEELILPWQVLDQLTDGAAEDAVAVVMITGADSVSAAALRQAVADVAAPYMVLSVQDMAEFTKSQIGMIDTVLVVVYALLGLSVILAALGIVNTLALSVIQRRRELGLLRAVGLGSGQTARMVVLESVILSMGGAVAGLVLGTALGALLTRLLRDQGLDQLAIPWGQLAAMAVIAALVGVVASVQGAIRAVRTPILTAVAAT